MLILQLCCVCSCVCVDTSGVCGTITVQHLLLNRNALFRCRGIFVPMPDTKTSVLGACRNAH